MRGNIVGLLAAALMGVCGVATANIIYNVDISGGGETMTGTITTDGAPGTLSLFDFVSWSLSASGPVSFSVFPSSFFACEPAGCGIDVVGSSLLFDGSSTNGLVLDTPGPATLPFVEFLSFEIFVSAGAHSHIFFLTTPYTVGHASAPEPPSAILLGIGLACLVFARKRSRGRQSTAV
jgi:hypothetical protein